MLSRSARRLATRLVPALEAGSAQAGGVGSCFDFAARSVAAEQHLPSASEVVPAAAGLWQQWRGLAGRSSGGGSGSSSSESSMDSDSDRDSDTSSKSHSSGTAAKPMLAKGRRREGGRWIGHEPNPQPQLQAWLQQEQGLPEEEADEYAKRLVAVFGGKEAAALASLPATFSWCRSQGLSGLETAQLLGRIASTKHGSVVKFATTAQLDWQRLDGYIRAHFQHQRQAGKRISEHASLASLLVKNMTAAQSLTARPGHVAAWLAAVEQRLPAADLRAILAGNPEAATNKPSTALGAINWAASKLQPASQTDSKMVEGVAGSEKTKAVFGKFFRSAPILLKCGAANLQGKLDNLQRELCLTAEQVWQLAAVHPNMLTRKEEKVRDATAWLRKFLPDTVEFVPLLLRAPALLRSPERLQRNAESLQRLGLSREQVAAFISDFPQVFAFVNLSGSETAAKLLLFTKVLGVASKEQCIKQYGGNLMRSLESMCALYILMQERAPFVFWTKGQRSLTWMMINDQTAKRSGISKVEMQRHKHAWARSEEGLRLLAGLRSGSIEGWTLLGSPPAGKPASARRKSASNGGPAAKSRRRKPQPC